ncbi:carbonic anhydrase [Pseudomonas rubra]|uniref:carbonic anhydrase n=1 Tax=Pseudomonas rubra TaxID=2942627 RepID=A0ABT5P537_9PSED|nr:carbonic anhydrase family protein [Pseudomonas rubra]MDD1013404.1 carbonic anhydrase family protein [Pseudomonas rubra]MDD1040477.1 carbonic anhydrase family protein [Pseudomonas rubra]MDD1155082.1 carbonic anhydrase family protein [Pseudomonas rubra]
MTHLKNIAFTTILAFVATSVSASGDTEWSYSGDTGPEHWASLSEEFATAIGNQQSPIDIELNKIAIIKPQNLIIRYEDGDFRGVYNGHAIQITPQNKEDNYVLLGGEKYTLQQFHFHTPSENQLDNHSSSLEVHFVHEDNRGRLAVIAVLFDKGKPNRPINDITRAIFTSGAHQETALPDPSEITELPPKNHEIALPAPFKITGLLPEKKDNIQFPGSLTTPPTKEGVTWIVMLNKQRLLTSDLTGFEGVMGKNNRPIQPTGARVLVKYKD